MRDALELIDVTLVAHGVGEDLRSRGEGQLGRIKGSPQRARRHRRQAVRFHRGRSGGSASARERSSGRPDDQHRAGGGARERDGARAITGDDQPGADRLSGQRQLRLRDLPGLTAVA